MSQTDGTATPVEPNPGPTEEVPTETATDSVEVTPDVATATPAETEEVAPPVETTNGSTTEETTPWYKSRAAVFISLLVLAALLIWGVSSFSNRSDATGSSGTPDGTAANALKDATGTVDPAVDKGVTSWTSWGKASLKNIDMESSMLEAHEVKYHKYYAQMVTDEKKGKTYKKLFPKGTRFINCDYNVKNDGKYVFFWDTLKKDTWFLVFPDGTPAVKTACGNTVILPKGVKPVAKKPPTKKNVKGPDTTGGAARQALRDKNAVRTPTPGYTGGGSGSTGKADQISQEQQATATSTDNNGQVGHASSGSGTNDSGETNAGGGPAEKQPTGGSTAEKQPVPVVIPQ